MKKRKPIDGQPGHILNNYGGANMHFDFVESLREELQVMLWRIEDAVASAVHEEITDVSIR